MMVAHLRNKNNISWRSPGFYPWACFILIYVDDLAIFIKSLPIIVLVDERISKLLCMQVAIQTLGY